MEVSSRTISDWQQTQFEHKILCRVFFYAQNQSLIQWSHGSVLYTCLQTCLMHSYHMTVTWLLQHFWLVLPKMPRVTATKSWESLNSLLSRRAVPRRAALGLNSRIDFRVVNFFGRIAPRRTRSECNFKCFADWYTTYGRTRAITREINPPIADLCLVTVAGLEGVATSLPPSSRQPALW